MKSFFKLFSGELFQIKQQQEISNLNKKNMELEMDKIYDKYVSLISFDLLSSRGCLKRLTLNTRFEVDYTFFISSSFHSLAMRSFLTEMEKIDSNFNFISFHSHKLMQLITIYINKNYSDIKANYNRRSSFEIFPLRIANNFEKNCIKKGIFLICEN